MHPLQRMKQLSHNRRRHSFLTIAEASVIRVAGAAPSEVSVQGTAVAKAGGHAIPVDLGMPEANTGVSATKLRARQAFFGTWL